VAGVTWRRSLRRYRLPGWASRKTTENPVGVLAQRHRSSAVRALQPFAGVNVEQADRIFDLSEADSRPS
jgi:hypothetical protein